MHRPRPLPTRPLRALAALACLTSLAACGGDDSVAFGPEGGPQTVFVTVPNHPTVEHFVRIDPFPFRTGDTVTISAVAVNRGTAAVTLQSRICGLDLEGTLRLSDPFASCGGHSQRLALAPRDSVWSSARRVIASPPGDYSLRIRLLIDPSVLLDLGVRVR